MVVVSFFVCVCVFFVGWLVFYKLDRADFEHLVKISPLKPEHKDKETSA